MSVEAAVNDLLARIHRDGGHYVSQHGIDKAIADAEERVVALMAERDELLDQKRLMIAALDVVLLFHGGDPWDWDKKQRWADLLTVVMGAANHRDPKVVGSHGDGTWDPVAPTEEATTKNLCNCVRAALKKAGTV